MSFAPDVIPCWRLRSQCLLQPQPGQPERVVAWLGGVQAQDHRWARWSIGLRMRDGSDSAVEQAIAARRVVRTWAFRGTLHFVAADDVHWLLRLLAPIVIAANARRYRQLELDEDTLSRSSEIIGRSLRGGRELSRADLGDALDRAGISIAGQRIFYMVQRAALDRVVCFGTQRGREPTYVRLSDWIGARDDVGPDQAPASLADRYIASHGPATAHDFAWWSGLPVVAARDALAAARSAERIEVDGADLWAAREEPLEEAEDAACLLPPFDDFLLGYKDRSAALDPAFAKRVNAGGGMPKPTIAVDGRIVGVWRRETKGGGMIVTVDPFRSLDTREQALLGDAVRRYSAFVQRPVELRL